MSEITKGDGYAVGHIDDMGDRYGLSQGPPDPRRERVRRQRPRPPARTTTPATTITTSRRSSTSSTAATWRCASATGPRIALGPGSAARVDPADRTGRRQPGRRRRRDPRRRRQGRLRRAATGACPRARSAAAGRHATIGGHEPRVRPAHQPHPGLPGGRRLRAATTRSRCWRPTRRRSAPCPRCSRRPAKRCRGQPLPRPEQRELRARAESPLRRAGQPDRDRQRLLRHPARRRRGPARARRRDRLLVAVLLDVPAPGGRVGRHRGDRRRSTPRSAMTSPAMAAAVTVATRMLIVCNPNNPTGHGGAARRHRGAAAEVAAPTCA